jgi:hypothetical protein
MYLIQDDLEMIKTAVKVFESFEEEVTRELSGGENYVSISFLWFHISPKLHRWKMS